MQNTPSRARPSGGWWKCAVVPATGDLSQGMPQLEFEVSGGAGSSDVDRPAGGSSYRVECPGGFKLQHGRLRPFPRARAAASMLVRVLLSSLHSPTAKCSTQA